MSGSAPNVEMEGTGDGRNLLEEEDNVDVEAAGGGSADGERNGSGGG